MSVIDMEDTKKIIEVFETLDKLIDEARDIWENGEDLIDTQVMLDFIEKISKLNLSSEIDVPESSTIAKSGEKLPSEKLEKSGEEEY